MIRYSAEIKEAMGDKKPIVALESTIISHGMPYPQNLETARQLQQMISDYGAVPATIGVVDGKIAIGLTDEELELFARSEDIIKVSSRDIPVVTALKKHGATTVAATMLCANMAKIKIFVTGGIGGVHRDAGETMDISADLTELAKTKIAVVCAGVKSILDIPKTLEYLETQGVPVLGYQSDEFPAFYTRESGCGVDYRVDTPEQIATIIHHKKQLKLKGGIVIANPISPQHAMEKAVLEEAIQKALTQAQNQNIRGKQITPFLLQAIAEVTSGASLAANISLVRNNAKLGAQIAVAYQRLLQKS